MNELEKAQVLEKQIMKELNLSRDEIKKLVAQKQKEISFINEVAALHLIYSDKTGKRMVDALSPADRAKQTLLDRIDNLTLEQIDELVKKLQNSDPIYQHNPMAALTYIAQYFGVALEEKRISMSDLPFVTIQEIKQKENGFLGNIKGMVVHQHVQRRKGGAWTKLYVTTIMDNTGQLTLKSFAKDNIDVDGTSYYNFSPYFLEVGDIFSFFQIKKEEGKEKETGGTWDDTYWWYGETEAAKLNVKEIPVSYIKKVEPDYSIHLIDGLISDIVLRDEYKAHDRLRDRASTIKRSKKPPALEVEKERYEYYPIYEFNLHDSSGTIHVRTEAFDFLDQFTQAGGGVISTIDQLNGMRVGVVGRALKFEVGKYDKVFIAEGLILASREEHRKKAIDTILTDFFDGFQPKVNGQKKQETPPEPEKKSEYDETPITHGERRGEYNEEGYCVNCSTRKNNISPGTGSCLECDEILDQQGKISEVSDDKNIRDFILQNYFDKGTIVTSATRGIKSWLEGKLKIKFDEDYIEDLLEQLHIMQKIDYDSDNEMWRTKIPKEK